MITINLRKNNIWIFAGIIIFLFRITYVIASWNPAAHLVYHNANYTRINVAGTYYDLQEAIDLGLFNKTSGGGATLPSCSNGQLFKRSIASWICSSDLTTKCVGAYSFEDGSGACRSSAEIMANAVGITTGTTSCSVSSSSSLGYCYMDCSLSGGFAIRSISLGMGCVGSTYETATKARCDKKIGFSCSCSATCLK